MLRDSLMAVHHHDGVLQQFPDVLLAGGLQQHLQRLPVHYYCQSKVQTMSDFHPEREPRIHFNPSNIERSSFISNGSQIGRLQQSQISAIESGHPQMVPKIIESGYIVGPPVAYTQQPNLPPSFSAFSPRNQNSSIIMDPSNNYPKDYSPHRSRSITPTKMTVNSPPNVQFFTSDSKIMHPSQPMPPSHPMPALQGVPQIMVHPPTQSTLSEETVPKAMYDHCLGECKNWETKYGELYLKFMNQSSQNHGEEDARLKEENYRLRQRVRDLQNRERGGEDSNLNIRQLNQRYKESALKEMYLLVDRYRLECRQNGR